MSTDLEHLEPGQRVTYFVGKNLPRARQAGLVETADIVWQMALRGEVDLLQRRLPTGEIAYLAIKRRKVDAAPVRPLVLESKHRRKAA
jgi:hypothetical protein